MTWRVYQDDALLGVRDTHHEAAQLVLEHARPLFYEYGYRFAVTLEGRGMSDCFVEYLPKPLFGLSLVRPCNTHDEVRFSLRAEDL